MNYFNCRNLIGVLALLLSSVGPGLPAQISEVDVNPQLPAIPQRKFALSDFNAVGDGKASNTETFRKAIAAVRTAGGGQLVVSPGIFITGPIELTDNMALVLEPGATIRGSENFKDYENTDETGGKENRFSKARVPALPLVRGLNLTNVEIRGEGTIDGAGLIWWQRFRADRAAGAPQEGQPA
jgi:polygalacturonase